MSLGVHCDGPDCQVWQSESSTGFFITVRETGVQTGDRAMHFCNWECVLRFAAQIDPPTEVTL